MRRSRAKSRERQFWFAAEGRRHKDGEPCRFNVYSKGRTVYITCLGGPLGYDEHLCHPSNDGSEQGVMAEIRLVYSVTDLEKVDR